MWGLWDASAMGKGGKMGMTVSSLGPARSGLGCQKPKVKAGPNEVSPHSPMS